MLCLEVSADIASPRCTPIVSWLVVDSHCCCCCVRTTVLPPLLTTVRSPPPCYTGVLPFPPRTVSMRLSWGYEHRLLYYYVDSCCVVWRPVDPNMAFHATDTQLLWRWCSYWRLGLAASVRQWQHCGGSISSTSGSSRRSSRRRRSGEHHQLGKEVFVRPMTPRRRRRPKLREAGSCRWRV